MGRHVFSAVHVNVAIFTVVARFPDYMLLNITSVGVEGTTAIDPSEVFSVIICYLVL